MNDKIGIWIDHRKAVIVFTSDGHATTKTLESSVRPHTRYSKRVRHSATGVQQDGGGEKSYEERHSQQLDRFYDDVISQLGQPQALLIFGPGEAKLQLRKRLQSSKCLSERVEEIEISDKLTDAQIVAKVKEHYGISLKRTRAIAKRGKSSGMGKAS